MPASARFSGFSKAVNDSWWVNPEWSARLAALGIDSFDDGWKACSQPADAVNRRGDGWALVHRLELPDAPDGCRAIYLKQQRNYSTRSFRHPLAGEPVVARELRNLREFAAASLPVPVPVCFGIRNRDGNRDALLGTAELTGYADLDAALQQVTGHTARARLTAGAGRLIRRLHDLRWEYRCLYPKHLMVAGGGSGAPEFAFIDLEKARRRVRARYGAVRDLASFVRRCPDWGESDWESFYRGYHGDSVRPEVMERLLAQVRARRERRA